MLGSLVGGPVPRWLGVTGPFWCPAVVMTALTVVAWRPFGRRVVAPNAPRGTLKDAPDPDHDRTRSN